MKWYRDRQLVRALPWRYRAYALYSRRFGDEDSRRVRGGSFLLRALRMVSTAFRLSTEVPVRGRDGLVVMADFSDERILEVIHEIRGENPEFHVMKSVLAPGDTFVDVGANFGTFSLLASRLVGPHGRVFAIEPQPSLATSISQSLDLSGITNCEVRNVACGEARGEARLLVPRDDTGRAGFFRTFSGRGRHDASDVPMIALDELMPEIPSTGSVMLKIDVEGSEFDVLKGARQLIASRRPTMLIELNPWSAQAAGRSTGELVDVLSDLGYRSFATMSSYPEFVALTDIDLTRQGNILALP
jgi:FkbM family methyltransferase